MNLDELINLEEIPPQIKLEEWIRMAGPEGMGHNKLCERAKHEGLTVRQVLDMLTVLQSGAKSRVIKGGKGWIHAEHIRKDPHAALKNLLYGTGIEAYRETEVDRLREVLKRAGFNSLGRDDIADLFGPR